MEDTASDDAAIAGCLIDSKDSYEHSWQLVEWLQAKHVLCVAVDASLRASYGYTCPACMPQVAHEEQEPQAEVGS